MSRDDRKPWGEITPAEFEAEGREALVNHRLTWRELKYLCEANGVDCEGVAYADAVQKLLPNVKDWEDLCISLEIDPRTPKE